MQNAGAEFQLLQGFCGVQMSESKLNSKSESKSKSIFKIENTLGPALSVAGSICSGGLQAFRSEMSALSGIARILAVISSLSLFDQPVHEKKHDEQHRLRLMRISSKQECFISVVLGALLCLTVKADTFPNVSTNTPKNSRRELLVSSTVSFVYTGAPETW